jgi:hypothetical protein
MMGTSVITTPLELRQFLSVVEAELGDPAASVGLLFVRWELGSMMSAHWERGLLVLRPGDGSEVKLQVSLEAPVVTWDGLEAFHVRRICDGVWALAPSLNIPGELHAFVVLHGVPDPAPWERLVLRVSDPAALEMMGMVR